MNSDNERQIEETGP